MSSSQESSAKPVRPDHEEARAQTEKLTAAIERYATRIQEIKDLTADRKGTRVEPSAEERSLLKTLNEARDKFQAALRQKQSIRDELNKVNQARESLRVKVRQMKENTKMSSIEEIDAQIKRLEGRINESELTEEEVQDCIAKIRQLVRSRETIRSLRKQLDSTQSDENPCEELMDRLKDIDGEMDKCKKREEDLKKQLDQMRKKREDEEMDISGMVSEKQECWQVICALRAKKKEINDAFTERMNLYKQQMKEYNAQRRKQERQQYCPLAELRAVILRCRAVEERTKEEEVEEEKVKEEEKVIERPMPKPAARKEKLRKERRPPQPVQEDTAWLKEREKKKEGQRLRQREQQDAIQQEKVRPSSRRTALHPAVKEETKTAETAASVSQSWSPSEAGMTPLKKGEDEERDAWMMGGKGKRGKHKKAKKPTKVEKPEDKILMHTLQIFQAFSDLKVAPPDTLADVPKAIQFLEELKVHYKTNYTAAAAAASSQAPQTKPEGTATEPAETETDKNPLTTGITTPGEAVDKRTEESAMPELASESALEKTTAESLTPELAPESSPEKTTAESLTPELAPESSPEKTTAESLTPELAPESSPEKIAAESLTPEIPPPEASEQPTPSDPVSTPSLPDTTQEEPAAETEPATPKQEPESNEVLSEEIAEKTEHFTPERAPVEDQPREVAIGDMSLTQLAKSQLPATLEDLDLPQTANGNTSPQEHPPSLQKTTTPSVHCHFLIVRNSEIEVDLQCSGG